MSPKRTAPSLLSVSPADLLSGVPLSEPEGFFVQEARRSGVCVTKMAQGRRPAFCCLSEECLLSGAGGGQEGSRDPKVRSFFLKGPKDSHSAPVPGRCPLAAFLASSPPHSPAAAADKDRPSSGRKSPASWAHHPSGCCLLFCDFVPRSCARAPGWTSFLLGRVAFPLPSPPPGVAGGGGLGVLSTRWQKFASPWDRYLGPLCWVVIIAEALTQPPPPPPPRSQLDFRERKGETIVCSVSFSKPHFPLQPSTFRASVV